MRSDSNGVANLGGIFRDKRELSPSISSASAPLAETTWPAIFSEVGIAELIVLLDDVIGVAATDAGVIFAELLPGKAEGSEYFGIADLC